jgi:flavin reductase (DIM6/NTAB) family NADH-FMN oxidoreductase RutF
MPVIKKKSFPLAKIRRFLEPGPIVLISSAHRGERNIMTLGWHMMLGFEPALWGCYIWDANHSYDLIRKSRECVINLPTADMIDTVIGIGNNHGPIIDESGRDKFEHFELTTVKASKVAAPLIGECYANFEAKLLDTRLVKSQGLFIFEVAAAHVAPRPQYPETVHYRGDGVFMISGENRSYKKQFKRDNL